MNEDILSDVMKVGENISPLSVALLLVITIVGVVLLITLCNGGISAVKHLWNRLFDRKE